MSGSGNEFLLVVELPRKLGRRFAEYNAGVRILLEDGRLLVWLPDLGVDRDVDLGDAVDDIDAPDIAFRRANP